MQRPDPELVNLVRAGDLTAFDELMRRYQNLVYRVVATFGANREDALDITQNVFLKAYRHLASFRGSASFKSWLLRIAYHEGINWTRSARRHPEQAALDSDELMLEAELATDGDTLERERHSLLARALRSLNERSRLALTLRYFRDMPLREIAEVLDCSEGNVKSLLFRGVRKLRDELAASPLGSGGRAPAGG